MPETVFDELKRYIGWTAADELALRQLHPVAQPHFGAIAHDFYERILAHDGARAALQGEAHVGKLKLTLVAWLDTLLTGPWDEAYFERRSRIGRVHVRISLPQHYMFGAMNFVRGALDALAAEMPGEPKALAATRLALNKMLDLELAIMLHSYREDLLSQQARTERLATFGQLVGSIGHELRNPLGVIETSLFILKGRLQPDEKVKKHVDRIAEQLFISNRIISDLLDMIRDRPLAKEALTLHDVVEAAIEAVKHPEGVLLRCDQAVKALPPVDGDRNQLRQVFVNLLDNAVHAVGGQGAVHVAGAHVEGHVHISVEDTGPGIDEATRRRLFEPLITTKDKGIGLGLALVRRIVQRHDGSIVYESRAEGGARFVVKLPVGSA